MNPIVIKYTFSIWYIYFNFLQSKRVNFKINIFPTLMFHNQNSEIHKTCTLLRLWGNRKMFTTPICDTSCPNFHFANKHKKRKLSTVAFVQAIYKYNVYSHNFDELPDKGGRWERWYQNSHLMCMIFISRKCVFIIVGSVFIPNVFVN